MDHRTRSKREGAAVTLHKGTTPGFDHFVHHDVQRANGQTWAIAAHDSTDDNYIVDGVYVFDGDGSLTKSWDVTDVYQPTGTENTGYWKDYDLDGQDWAHANAVSVAMDGGFLFSLTAIHSVLRVNSAGTLDWELNGAAGGDFTITGSSQPNFYGQHHVYYRQNGRFVMFDDRNTHTCQDSCETARVIEMELEGSQTAKIVKEYPIGEQCTTQGSAYFVPTGGPNVLISCSAMSMIRELDDTGTAYWDERLGCKTGTSHASPLYRAIPISL